jgi:uncharacterized protein YdhG (YjbR/CyaY superfamily)
VAQSRASTVEQYLAELPPERRAVVSAVREVVRANLPAGYAEEMSFGMIGYVVPLAQYPDTYNGQPLAYAALAAQKGHYALYLNCASHDPAEATWLADAFRAAGKKLDMGKSCLRFRSLADLPLEAVGAFIARTPPERLIAQHEMARAAASRR